MERLLEVGLSNALMAAALAAVATLAGLVCRRPALVHALWLLVLLKLLTPPLFPFHVLPAVPLSEKRARPDTAQAIAPTAEGTSPDSMEATDRGAEEFEWEREAAPADAGPDGAPVAEPIEASEAAPVMADDQPAFAWFNGLAWVWLLGSLGWFALASRRVWRFSRALRHARPSPALQGRVERLAQQIGLARSPIVLQLPGRLAPLVWWFGRPILVVPEGLETLVGEGGLDLLLLHELAHLYRRDHLVRWLEFFALGSFWWNPVAWFARRELREAEEQCCDAWVIRTLPGTGRAYATALVDAIDFLSEARPALPPLASGLGHVADLKRRLTMILRGNTPARLGRSNGLVVSGLALLLLPLVPVWGQAQKETAETPQKPVEVRFQSKVEVDGPDMQQLRLEIEKKAKELVDLKEKLAVLAKKAAEQSTKQAANEYKLYAKRIADTHAQLAKAGAAMVVTGGPVIRIEISGIDLKPEALEALVHTLEKSLPGKEKRVTVVVGTDSKGKVVGSSSSAGTYYFRSGSGSAVKESDPTARRSPTPPVPPPATKSQSGGFRGTLAPAGSDRRIEGLEKKLDILLQELESIRREMRRTTPRGGGAGTRGGASGNAGDSGGRNFLPDGGKRPPSSSGSN